MKIKLPEEIERVHFFVSQLNEFKGWVEMKKLRAKRTLSQNNYLHSLIALYAIETGYTLDEMKQNLKDWCPFMRYEKKGSIYFKSSAKLDTKEMTDWINWIRDHAGVQGYYLPTPDDYQRNWQEIERTIERVKNYL